MIDKDTLEIGTEIYHKVIKRKGVYDECCVLLELMNDNEKTIFISFDDNPKSVLIEDCVIVEFEMPNICQMCFKKLGKEEKNICTLCAIQLKNKIDGE